MLIKEASVKWNISERRIRKLIELGRIENAQKLGTVWFLPEDSAKPIDKRYKKAELPEYEIDNRYFKDLDERNKRVRSTIELNRLKPLNPKYSQIKRDNFSIPYLKEDLFIKRVSESLSLLGMKITPLEVRKIAFLGETIPTKNLEEHILIRNYVSAMNNSNKMTRLTYEDFKRIYHILTFGLEEDTTYQISSQVREMLDKYYKIRVSNPYLAAAYIHTMIYKIKPFKKFNGLLAQILLNTTLLHKNLIPITIPSNRVEIYKEAIKEALDNNYTKMLKIIIIEENNILDTYEKIINFS